jgi:mediator of RNA polymerase II transcription subunit 13
VCGDCNFSSEPLDDPVLASFSRCLAGDILCVWRRVATQQPTSAAGAHSANQGAGGLFDSIGLPPGLGGPGPAAGGQNQHPPLSLHAAKELWIFWYGEEPDLSGLVSPELIAAGEFKVLCF